MEEKISSTWAFFISAIIQNNNPKYKGRPEKKLHPAPPGLKILEKKPENSTMKILLCLSSFLLDKPEQIGYFNN
jgi:hypothetical protein